MSVNNKTAAGTPVSKRQRMESADIETGVSSTSKTAVWKIKDFAKFREVNSLIEGQNFKLDVTDNNGVMSHFRVSLIRTMEEGKIYRERGDLLPPVDEIGLCVKLLSKNEVSFIFSAEVHRATGRKLYNVKNERIISACQNDDIPYPGLLNNLRPESTLPLEDGALIIRLKFEVFSSTPDTGLSASLQMKDEHITKLEKIMGALENDTKSANATIISNDGERFPAHRFILTNISSVFERMLNVDMLEKNTGEIKLNVSGKCVKILRHFIYTGELAEGWKEPKVLMELAYAAPMYCLDDLVRYIDKVLGGLCTPENAPELMVLANKLGMKMAEKHILSVVKMTTENVDDFLAVVKRLSSN